MARATVVVLGRRRAFVNNAAVPFNNQNLGNSGTAAANFCADLTSNIQASLGATSRAT